MVDCGTVDVLSSDPGTNVTMDACSSSDQVSPGSDMSFTADVTNNNDANVQVDVIWRLDGTDAVSQSRTISPNSTETLSQTLGYDSLPANPGTTASVTAEIVGVSFTQFIANTARSPGCSTCGPKSNSVLSNAISSAGSP